MNIENEIFEKYEVNIDELKKYGFQKNSNKLLYKKDIMEGKFTVIIEYDNEIKGKIIEKEFNDEYTNFRRETLGEFNASIKQEFIDILKDIRRKCCSKNDFKFPQTIRINNYIKEKYKVNPEFLWEKFPGYAVYRNESNNKWYAIIMNLDLSKLDNGTGEVEIINVKLDENKIQKLLKQSGFYEAYHMSKTDWISIILNDTLMDEEIISLIEESYNLISEPEEWIVPANPKYYDVINCFNDTDEIIWKQSSDIHVNDIIYLYVADPYSKIMYKCKAIEVNIPYEYKDKNVSMRYVMKIKLLKKLENRNYTFEYLNKLGIKAVRGPRKITKEISERLE